MNRIYRLVWNRALRVPQVASELVHGARSGVSTPPQGQPRWARRPLAIALASVLILGSGGFLPMVATAGDIQTAGGAGGGDNNGAWCNCGSGGSGGLAGGGGGGGGAGGAGGNGATLTLAAGSGADGSNSRGGFGASGLSGGGGGGGGLGGSNSDGGNGASGTVSGSTYFQVVSGATLAGGLGVNGGNGGSNREGGAGGGGGALVLTATNAQLDNAGTIVGGKGGTVIASNGVHSGAAGGGGAGVVLVAGGAITNASGAVIAGGAAGDSNAGAGGAGLFLYDGGTLSNAAGAAITGGAGSGGNNLGGNGAAGVLSNRGVITNNGSINGGQGGNAYFGGTGGTGAVINQGSLLNTGVINGGAGSAGNGGGAGGAGVGLQALGGASITNSGTISAGLSGSGVRGSAITLSGGGNTLTLLAGSSIVGYVLSYGGDTFALGGSTDASFDATVLEQSYLGFDSLQKVGTSNWTLTGTASNYRGWTVRAGTLSVSSDDNLGLSGAALTLDGGTLRATTDMYLARSVVIGAAGGTLQGNGVLGLSGPIDGAGALLVQNTGTTIFNRNVGAVTALTSLTTDAAGSTTLNANVTTTGAQAYGNAVTLASATTLTSTAGGTIGFASTVDGAAKLSIGTSGAIVFGGAVGGTTALGGLTTSSGTFSAGALNINGALSITTTAGGITSSGPFAVRGTSSFNAGAHEITLTQAANNFGGAVSLSNSGASNVALNNGGHALTLGASSVGSGTLSVAGTGITQTGAVTQAGGADAVTLDGGAGAVTLNNAGNNFTGALTVSGSDVSITNAGVLNIASATTTGSNGEIDLNSASHVLLNGDVTADTVVLGSGDNLSQIAGALTANTLSVQATGAATLTNANAISTLGNVSTGQFSLSDLLALTITGTVTASSVALMDSQGITVTGAIHAGDTDVAAGTTLQIGKGGTTGSITGDIADNGALVFARSDALNVGGAISGSGMLTQRGAGTLVLDGNSSAFAGSTEVQSGGLIIGSVAGNGATLGGDVQVDSGASLGGHGTIGGNANVASGAHLAPGASIGTLTINGNATFAQGSQLDFEFGAPGASFHTAGTSDSVAVGGNLALNGAVLNVADAGGFGPGLYNLFSYGGTLTLSNGGIVLGSTPAGSYSLQYLSAAKQINLLNASAMTLNFWNGNGLAGATQMGGGNGTWTATSANWTDQVGTVTLAMQPQPGFAILGGSPGTVTVDNSAGNVMATGMQFASNGYTLTGGTLTLVGAGGAAPVIRVGDGSSAGAGMVATIGNVLTGSAGMVKADLGTLVLTAANTYVGGTTINAGTLQLGNGGASGSITGDVVDNGVLAFNRSDMVHFDGAISGTGTLLQQGSGTTVLINANSYSGGTTIASGTLQLGNGGASGSITGDVVDNGVLAFNRSDAVHFDGAISGTGTLLQQGSGTTILTNANSYSGGTTIASGTLQLGDGGTSGSISGNVDNRSALAFNRSDVVTFDGTVSGNGVLMQNGSGTLVLAGGNTYTGGTVVNAGTLQGDAHSLQGNITDNASLVFAQDVDASFAGSLTGHGTLIKVGAGTLLFNGNNAFAGNTVVQAGTLAVGDESHPAAFLGGDVVVNAGGTLRGHGTIGGDVVNNGTLWPGGSVGTLTIQGNYTQNANSTWVIDALPDGTADRLSVGGKATIFGGSVVTLTPTGTWAPRTDYTILTAAGGVSGEFAGASSSLAFLNPVLSYSANAVQLSLQRNDIRFDAVAQTPNQTAVAMAANPLGFDNAVYSALVTLDATAARRAFDRLSGEIHASTRTAIIDDDRYVREAIGQHLLGMDNRANGLDAGSDNGVTAWSAVWGHWGNHDHDGNAADMAANGSGLLVGADLPIDGASRLGAAIGSGQGTARIATLDSSSHNTNTHAGVYGATQAGAFQLQGGVIYGWQKVDTNRTTPLGASSGTAGSSYDANTSQAYVDGGYAFTRGGTTLMPFVNLVYEHLRTDAIREHGSVAALDVAAQDSTLGIGTLGVRGSFALDDKGGLHAHASLGWQHAWGDTAATESMRFVAGGAAFDIAGLPVARNATAISGGLSFLIAPGVSVDATYSGQFASHAKDQAARMSLTWVF
ncbi:MAG TPA: autotransporter-associated beta strand repeat-containing protein [Dyella sp.]|uniref:autotransporter-associated beta strand repeat-containing protein n=1 Tax=Dyella sp. TaxID=1869338 RepID=UPI002D777E97|nr:autotransporter-associated beta strand repeat-containing protein [Dyella sp.]HET6552353.1 autotransporter-associated beta strand repeat-containing protein [Dyella sp.]